MNASKPEAGTVTIVKSAPDTWIVTVVTAGGKQERACSTREDAEALAAAEKKRLGLG